ncbi:MAG TPA: efflux RND transporter permease subunit [Enhygromyxa sp.]|nr:efflux RND transporter permease subunit [Enhygromyxa sp.]
MRAIIDYFVRRHFLVNVMVAAVVVLGVWTATHSQREGFPAVTLNQLIVTAKLPGASAIEVERELTVPIEDAVAELDGVDTYHSVITDNLSITTIELDDDWDADQVRLAEGDLRQSLDAIKDFPERMRERPTISRVEAAKFPILEIALAGPSTALPEAAEQIEAALAEVEGIAKIELVGLEDPELRVLVDPVQAKAHNLGLDEIMAAIERRNVASTGGVLESDSGRRQIVLDSRYHDRDDVAQTVIAVGRDGSLIRVADVARVELTRRDEGLRVHTNGAPGISVVVRKQADADILTTVDAIVATMDALELPAGVEAVLVNDASFMTRNRLQLMVSNGIVGMVLVIAILLVFLDARAALWVAAGVPVALLGVVALLPTLGMTLNMLTLAGFVVVLGMLVDDAVVIAERIVFRQGEGLGRGPRAAVAGVTDVALPVVASAITTMLAFSPMFSLGGMPGKFAWALPVVVILALTLSLLESFFILPAHMSPARDDDHEPPAGSGEGSAMPKAERPLGAEAAQKNPSKRRFMVALERGYRALLVRALRWRALVLVLFIAGAAFIMGVIRPQMGFQLFPQDDSDALFIQVTMPVGTPIEQTEAAVAAIEQQLPDLVGHDFMAVTARIGHRDGMAVDRTVGAAAHEAVIAVMFVPLERERTSAEWAEYLGQRLAVPERASLLFEAKRIGPPLGSPVTLHVAGNDDEARRATAEAAAQWLREQDGIADVSIDERPGLPRVELDLDHDKLALRGLDVATVGRTLTAAFYGLEITELRELDETTRIRVQLEPSARADLDALLELPLRSATGERTRLRDVVHPVEVRAVSRILHRDGVRTATVTASFSPGSGLDANAMAKRIDAELLPGLAAASGDADVVTKIGGEATETKKTTGDMQAAMGIAVLGILTVIALMIGSFLEALFIISVIPFGAAGVILAFFLHGKPLSMFAMLGIIGLAGVVVNAAIVMIDAINSRVEAARTDPERDGDDAMIDAVVERLRPILVTTLTTCGGVLPTAYGLGGYDAVLSPMSLALGWGLLFATAITLLLVPCLYRVAQDVRRIVGRIFKRSWG